MKTTLWCAALLTGLALAALVAAGPIATRSAPQPPVAAAPALRAAWPMGERHLYRLEWSAEERAVLGVRGGARVDGAIEFAGELGLVGRERLGDGFLVAASLGKLDRHHLALMGQEVLPSEAVVAETFAGREALVEIDERGRVRALYFHPKDPPTFRYVLQALLLDST